MLLNLLKSILYTFSYVLTKLIIFICIILLYKENLYAKDIKNFNNFKSHEAVYNLRTNNVSSSSKVHSALGQMNLEVYESCEGWVINQNSLIDITDKHGTQYRNEFRYSIWESFNGNLFRFLSQVIINGEEIAYYEGQAYKSDKDAKIIYIRPRKKEVNIPIETLFPMKHFMATLKLKNKNFKSYTVFTGENEESLNHVNSFSKEVEIDGQLFKKIRTAVFELNSVSSEPVHEIELIIDNYGIARSVVFDYLDYKIIGNLKKYKFIAKKKC